MINKIYGASSLKVVESLVSKQSKVLIQEEIGTIRSIKNFWFSLKIKKTVKKFRIVRFFQEIWISTSVKKLVKREFRMAAKREAKILKAKEQKILMNQNLVKMNHPDAKCHAV